MVPPSWPMLRSHCVGVGRSQLKKTFSKHQQVRSLTTTRPTRLAWTLSFSRLSHSFVDTSQSPRAADFPINIIQKQTLVRAFSALVEEGKLNEASALLSDILATTSEDLEAFQFVKDTLASTERDNNISDLILQLGLAAISKGQTDFIENEVLPLLEERGGNESLSLLRDALRRIIDTTPSEPGIFESSAEDYPAESSLTGSLSTLEIIEQQLPAILPETSVDGDSIFEEDMTGGRFGTTNARLHDKVISEGHFDRLLRHREYEEAFQFLQEMKTLGTNIRPRIQYVEYALAILQNTPHDHPRGPTTPNQIEKALTLLPFMPRYDTVHKSANLGPKLEELISYLLTRKAPRIDLLSQVSIILASKGFVRETANLVPVVVRNLPEKECIAFVKSFEASYKTFSNSCLKSNSQDFLEHHHKAEVSFRNRVISTLFGSRRLGEAIDFLWTWDTFILWRSNLAYLSQISKKTGRLTILMQRYKAPMVQDEESIRVSILPHVDLGDNPRTSLLYIKNALSSKTHVPHPFTIVNFINLSLARNSTTGLRILFDRAHRTAGLASVNFAFAEMLFYRRLKLHDLVIKTFLDHFYLHGAPIKLFLVKYKKVKEKKQNTERIQYDHGSISLAERFYSYNTSILRRPERKLWPHITQVNIVWDALVGVTALNNVHRLYKLFLSWAQFQHDAYKQKETVSHPKSDIDWNKDPRMLEHPILPTSSSFLPFVRPLLKAHKLSSPRNGKRVINDMLDLGIAPHKYVYTEVASFYAQHGNEKSALEILDSMEQRTITEHKTRDGTMITVENLRPPIWYSMFLY